MSRHAALRNVVEFSEPGDGFVLVLRQHFECFLCKVRAAEMTSSKKYLSRAQSE